VSDITASLSTPNPSYSSNASSTDDLSVTEYLEKLNSFITATNSFDHKQTASGLETSNIFHEIRNTFTDILVEKESIHSMQSDIASLINMQTGFTVTASEPFEVNGTKFRFVELSNVYTESTNGAFDSLFVQYWTDKEIAYAPLVESRPTSTGLTTVIDYRFIEDECIVLVVQKEYCDVFKREDSYNLFLFQVANGHVENAFADKEISINNGYWKFSGKEFTFFDPERTIIGFHVKEITEDDNAHKTSIQIADKYITVQNIDAPESSIKIELIDGTWKLSS